MATGVPSSDTFFQNRSWKLILASVVCCTSSFTSSYRPEVDGLAMPFLVHYLWSETSQTSSEGCKLLPSGIEVLGADRSCDTHVRGVSGDQVNATYMPKSAITISDDGSFVRNRMFSGLRTRWTMSWSCRYFMPDNIERSTETASRSEKCPRWLMRSKSSPPTASSKAR